MNHNQASILDYEEVARVLGTDLGSGLTAFEARERLKKYGYNKLEPDSPSSKSVPKLIVHNLLTFSRQFLNPLIQILLLCVIISACIGEYENSISVSVSILLVCAISFIQERRADRSLEKLNKQMPNMCKVFREAQTMELESQFLVPGDIIYLQEGQRVPADLRLFDIISISLNEANLTGETQAQVKSVDPVIRKVASVLSGQSSLEEDKYFINQNLAMMGTIVEMGRSRGIVIQTGKSTRYGQVYCMLKNTNQPRSPLQNNIDQLSLHLVVISCSVIGFMSILGIIQQRPLFEVAYFAISLAVTAIPEGLPVVVAVIMALGVLRLSKQKTIVKSLNSIETLGCIQVLCADKTGTLTRNDMTLTDIVTSELHSISSTDLEQLNNEECRKQMTFNKFGGKLYSIGRLMEVGTLCNNASIDPDPSSRTTDKTPAYLGQATEIAILDAALRMGFGDSRNKFDRLSEVPFSSGARRMVVSCRRLDVPSNGPLFYVKGAWEEILRDCTHYYENGLVKVKNQGLWREYERICVTLGSQGLRVLALATGSSLDQLSFVGLIGINNALRDGIVDTLEELREQFHIDLKMITGDSLPTAIAVGRSLNLIPGNNDSFKSSIRVQIEDTEATEESCYQAKQKNGLQLEGINEESMDRWVMSGEQIQELLDSNLDELYKAQEINAKTVFYRVDPTQKARIISKLQELDKIVAMTGDGVNDVISMKRANLSLVMGSGADVCKEVADVIIVENDLSVLKAAIIEGRAIYRKLHSFMSYQISLSLSLICLIALSFATRVQAPFTVSQLLFINILADGPPAQSLGAEPCNMTELKKDSRNVQEPILNCQLLRVLFFLSAALVAVNGSLYYSLLDDSGKLDAHARSMIFTCFVFCSIFAAFSLRSKTLTVFEMNPFGNLELLCCSLILVLIQIILIFWAPLSYFFEIEPLNFVDFVYLFICASLVLVVMDSIKLLVRLSNCLTKHFRSRHNESKPSVNDPIKTIP